MTFSIAGADPDAGDWGVAVASKFLAVGAVVPYARAGIGAVATQAWANTDFGPQGLDLMAAGSPAPVSAATIENVTGVSRAGTRSGNRPGARASLRLPSRRSPGAVP